MDNFREFHHFSLTTSLIRTTCTHHELLYSYFPSVYVWRC